METKQKVLITLKRNILPGINLFELVLFIVGTTVGCGLFIWQMVEYFNGGNVERIISLSYVISLIDIPLGVLAATWLSKKNKWAPLLLMADALLYGTANLIAGNMALFLANAVLTPILWMVAMFYLWPRQEIDNSGEVKTRKLDMKKGIILVSIILGVAIIVGVLQMKLTDDPKDIKGPIWFINISIWFDSFAAVMMVSAVVLGVLRFRETWYLYFIANFLKIILFSMSLAFGNMDDLLLIVIASIYFLNAMFGMAIWGSSDKENKHS